METQYKYGIALAIIAILGVSFVSASGLGFFKPDQEDRDEIKAAVESGDYATWKSLMESRIAEMQAQITEENFNKMKADESNRDAFMSAVLEAKKAGTLTDDKMQELRTQYNISDDWKGFGKGFMKDKPMHKNCPLAN